ncbi:MAG TPA: HEAT repeat domain-containing protein [Verrucomicrobiae bacterium]
MNQDEPQSTKPALSLAEAVKRFRAWAAEDHEGEGIGEWECDYEHWSEIYDAFNPALDAPLSPGAIEDILYAIARDNEVEVLRERLTTRPEILIALAPAALVYSEFHARWQIAVSLGEVGSPAALEILRKFIDDPQEYVRRRALIAYAPHRSAESEPIAWAWLSSEEPYSRLAALHVLRDVHSSRWPDAVEMLQGDPCEFVRQRAIEFAAYLDEKHGRAPGEVYPDTTLGIYDVIFWEGDGQPDSIYTVVAPTYLEAVKLAEHHRSEHTLPGSDVSLQANTVSLLGPSALGDVPKILHGPIRETGYTHGDTWLFNTETSKWLRQEDNRKPQQQHAHGAATNDSSSSKEDIHITQSLAQLTGVDWGAPPPSVSSVVQERHTLRRTPLQELSLDALKRLLALDFEEDHLHLIPYCLQRIDKALNAQDDDYLRYCNLLLAVLANEKYDWLAKPELVHQTRNLVNRACHELYRDSDAAEGTNDSLAYYRVLQANIQMQAALYEKLARFEQRFSKIGQ